MAFPNDVDSLIQALDKQFPELAVQADSSMDEIKFRAGQRSVVQFLKTWRSAPKETAPTRQRGQGRSVRRPDA